MALRLPEPAEYEIDDPAFTRLVRRGGLLRHLADGCAWAEGPAYLAAESAIVWSDVRNNRRLRHDVLTGENSVDAEPSNFSNGHTVDGSGRLLACEHGTRSVVRFEHDGGRSVIADRFDGARLNSPNDLVVGADDSIWFSDPTYGIDSDAEGYRASSEIGSNNVYRVDPATGKVSAEITDMVQPNGLAFAPGETALYVADTGATHVDGGPRHIRRFDIVGGAVVGGGEVFATCPDGLFDGFRLDEAGRLWASGGRGVHCYDVDGRPLGTILLPEPCANLTFGGPDDATLYMTATSSLYALDVEVSGAG